MLPLRGPYVLDFLGMESSHSEADLESAISDEMQRILLEDAGVAPESRSVLHFAHAIPSFKKGGGINMSGRSRRAASARRGEPLYLKFTPLEGGRGFGVLSFCGDGESH